MENNDNKIYKEGDIVECKRCEGKGVYVTYYDAYGVPYPCEGNRKITCANCNGKGYIKLHFD